MRYAFLVETYETERLKVLGVWSMSRAWVVVRRKAHTSHHRGQQMAMLRMLDRDLHSNYGPTSDSGGLMRNQTPVGCWPASSQADARRRSLARESSRLPSGRGAEAPIRGDPAPRGRK